MGHRSGRGSSNNETRIGWTTRQPRFYDFVVFSEKKRVEKLRYMHGNPVKRGLVLEPKQWRWGSYRHYAFDEAGPVVVNAPQRAEMRVRKVS